MVLGRKNPQVIWTKPNSAAARTTIKRYTPKGYRQNGIATLGTAIFALFPYDLFPGLSLHFLDEFLFLPVNVFVF